MLNLKKLPLIIVAALVYCSISSGPADSLPKRAPMRIFPARSAVWHKAKGAPVMMNTEEPRVDKDAVWSGPSFPNLGLVFELNAFAKLSNKITLYKSLKKIVKGRKHDVQRTTITRFLNHLVFYGHFVRSRFSPCQYAKIIRLIEPENIHVDVVASMMASITSKKSRSSKCHTSLFKMLRRLFFARWKFRLTSKHLQMLQAALEDNLLSFEIEALFKEPLVHAMIEIAKFVPLSKQFFEQGSNSELKRFFSRGLVPYDIDVQVYHDFPILTWDEYSPVNIHKIPSMEHVDRYRHILDEMVRHIFSRFHASYNAYRVEAGNYLLLSPAYVQKTREGILYWRNTHDKRVKDNGDTNCSKLYFEKEYYRFETGVLKTDERDIVCHKITNCDNITLWNPKYREYVAIETAKKVICTFPWQYKPIRALLRSYDDPENAINGKLDCSFMKYFFSTPQFIALLAKLSQIEKGLESLRKCKIPQIRFQELKKITNLLDNVDLSLASPTEPLITNLENSKTH